jgi:D-alanyl-D-alanine carboxypeptidase (penicillin-binding protein 5/6)
MTLSIVQKLLLLGTRAAIFVFWLIDTATSVTYIKISRKILKTATLVISVFFIFLLLYSYSSRILAKIADGYFSDLFVIAPSQYHPREYPVLVSSGNAPYVTSKSYLIADIKNSKILYEHNINQKHPPASTAKLMTALVALDIYQTNEVLEVPEACSTINGTKAYLPVKSHFSVKDLIYSMLIGSAGDSACVLSLGKLPYENFVSLMNRKASLTGLLNTHFSNPIGLDDDGGQNFSTVQDLFTLAKSVMQNPIISDAVRKRVYELKSQDGLFDVNINSTNKFLSEIPNTLGIKTGTTESAGEVFIYDYADKEKDLIIIVMGSSDRFSDTRTLLTWALNSYSWK